MDQVQENVLPIKKRIFSFSNDELTIIRSQLGGATEDEFKMFIHIAETYYLDPLNKEIWFFRDEDNKPVIMTSRDGYLKIANRNPHYDGLVSDVIKVNDKFIRKSEGIEHVYGGVNRGNIIGAYALVYRKDRKYPFYAFASFQEYNAATSIWNQYPSAMILKVAESMALKKAFSISGLVSYEELEISKNYRNCSDNMDKHRGTRILSKRELIIKDIIDDDINLRNILYTFLNDCRSKGSPGKISINDLTDEQFKELKQKLLETK